MRQSFFYPRVVVIAAVLVISSVQAGETRSGGSTKNVQVKASVAKADEAGNQVITVSVAIDKGWHIYANPVGNSKVAEAKTTLTVTSKGKPQVAKIEYPPGNYNKKENVRIYEDKITIRATVRRPADGTPLELALHVVVCNDNTCYPPGTIRFTVP